MKKLFIFVLLSLALGTLCYAENSAVTYSTIPMESEMVVYVEGYNPSTTTAITSNAVVVLSTNAANASYKATGAVVATSTTQDDPLAFGVTDQVIPIRGSGRICVRGPHKVLALGTVSGSLVAGASMATTTTAGYVSPLSVQSQSRSVVGTLLNTSLDPNHDSNGVVIEGPVYWMWVGR